MDPPLDVNLNFHSISAGHSMPATMCGPVFARWNSHEKDTKTAFSGQPPFAVRQIMGCLFRGDMGILPNRIRASVFF
ncbi:MAG: hypothetical protein DRH56_07610 [Deltaproteobacteria bacterium]|nr:MAG: hypothetical protein DRH56_07610 [Deltaproteobacteria bacterium]